MPSTLQHAISNLAMTIGKPTSMGTVYMEAACPHAAALPKSASTNMTLQHAVSHVWHSVIYGRMLLAAGGSSYWQAGQLHKHMYDRQTNPACIA